MHFKISLKEIKAEMEKNSMVNRRMWTKHVLAPTGEDLVGKVVIEGDGVTAVENETKKTIPLPPIWVALPLQVELGRSLLEPKNKPWQFGFDKVSGERRREMKWK